MARIGGRKPGGVKSGQAFRRRTGGWLRQLRHNRGLSLRQVAAAGILSQGALSDIENGKRLPSLPTILQLAGLYRVKLAHIIHPDDSRLIGRGDTLKLAVLGDESE